jgi:transposase
MIISFSLLFNTKLIINMPPKTDRKELDEPTKNQIIGMKMAGQSGRNIAIQLGLVQSTVNRIIKHHMISGSVKNNLRPGRLQKLSKRDHRHLLMNVKKNRRLTLQEITKEIPSQPSLSTIRRTLHDANLNNRIAIKKPFICARNQAKRLAFALKYQHLTVEDWKHILWTDESTFEIGKNTQQVRIWRSSSERYNTACITPSFKSGRTSVMVWGCFMWGKLGPLVILSKDQRFDSKKYVNILEEHLLDFWMEQSEEIGYVVFQEDNSPIHTSKLAKQWRESMDIQSLQWPPNSPDLNPIEHIWYILKTTIQKMEPRPMTIPSTIAAIRKAWNKLDVNILNNLVESMPDRLAAVIQAKGGNTKY